MNRRDSLALLATAFAAVATPSVAQTRQAPKQLRIGFQKTGILIVAKQQKLFETRFASLGVEVKFVEFSSGPPLLEALNAGAIDYGYTGDSPPIFAQAARANLLYVAAQPSAGSTSAILIKDGSSIRTLADLKGKKVAFTKASSAHNVTIAALEKAGLQYSDITPVYLQPADAAAAFARGSVDAWTIWDPFYAIAEEQPGTKVLATAKEIVRQNSFLLANREFTGKHPDIVGAINVELAKAIRWIQNNQTEAAELFAQATGIPKDIQAKAIARNEFLIAPVSEAVIVEQQAIADRFHKLALIPAPINVREIVWNWTPST